MFCQKYMRMGVQKGGWAFLPVDVQDALREELLDMAIVDVKRKNEPTLHETVTPKEVIGLIQADPNIMKMLEGKYGNKFSLNQVVGFLDHAPILREYVISLGNNRMSRIIEYLSWKEEHNDLSDEETSLLSVLLEKFGGPLGAPTPELYLERCKKETEELVNINKEADEREEKAT